MSKNKRNSEKGITLVSLTITIIILLLITGTIIYNSRNSVSVVKIDNLYSDINSITNKINEYYVDYGELPTICEYLEQDDLIELIKSNATSEEASLLNSVDILNPNDGETYYVIDLEKLDGLSLNYGYDDEYFTIKTNRTYTTSSIEDEIYIINGLTHQIYFPHGIFIDKVMYYTDNADEFSNM